MNHSRTGLGRIRHAATLTALVVAGCQSVGSVAPPAQPATGPGGADYAHRAVTAQRVGEGENEYWLFLPEEPMPEQAPFVVFLHGWSGTDPWFYGGWIQHIVRKGHIVVFPRYQADLRTRVPLMVAAALRAVQDAWERLNTEGPIRPVQDRIAWVGHSLGATIAVKLAAASLDHGLPQPGALLLVQPGGASYVGLEGLDRLPTDTLVSVVVGDADTLVGESGAEAVISALGHMPASHVEKITIRSDRRSDPALVADHVSPLSTVASFPPDPSNASADASERGRSRKGAVRRHWYQRQLDRYAPDALDYFGYWKLCDGLLDATFRQLNLEYAFGNTGEQQYMGLHSDGMPVVPLLVGR